METFLGMLYLYHPPAQRVIKYCLKMFQSHILMQLPTILLYRLRAL